MVEHGDLMSGLVTSNGQRLIAPKDEAPKFEDLTPAQQEALAAKAAENGETGAYEVATAYYVIIDRNGAVIIVPDLSVKLVADRQPSPQDILGSAAVVQATVTSQITAHETQQVMLQQARAMAQQQQQAQDAQRMQGLNLRT
jgi:hypothetical protein